jgi:hypothetical protein
MTMTPKQAPTKSSLERLRELGRIDLGAWGESTFGTDEAPVNLWSVQSHLAQQMSVPRATVASPSCHSSGKTFVAALIILGFWWTYPDSKVVIISSLWDQLLRCLWGDLRTLANRSQIDLGIRILAGEMAAYDTSDSPNAPNHYIIGQSPKREENIQGHHAPHVLIVVDEATALDPNIAEGIRSLRTSGDTRMLVIFNPSSVETWPYGVCQDEETVVVPITAWDTPNFSHLTREQIVERYGSKQPDEFWEARVPHSEPVPPGADLLSDTYLQSLIRSGKGPGHPTWENRVEARFLSAAMDQLIHLNSLTLSRTIAHLPGPRTLGIDLASYSDAENTITYRQGNAAKALEAFPALNPKIFWNIVRDRVEDFEPRFVIYDADGPGAGSYETAERACGAERLIPIRGELAVPHGPYANYRSYLWWSVAEGLREGRIAIDFDDETLWNQLLSMTYSLPKGIIRMATKEELKSGKGPRAEAARRKGVKHLDRADGFVLAFAHDPPSVSGKVAYSEDRDMELNDEWADEHIDDDEVELVEELLGFPEW